MFAYCNNNPVCCVDHNGRTTTFIKNQFQYTYVGDVLPIGAGGCGVILNFCLIEALEDFATTANTWYNDLEDAIVDKLKNSLAMARHREYRSEYEEHHIVAKKAPNAAPAAAILNKVLSGGVEDPMNKVMVKTSVHRRLHTTLYYSLANAYIITAYNTANGDEQQQYNNVVGSLMALRLFIETLNACAIN